MTGDGMKRLGEDDDEDTDDDNNLEWGRQELEQGMVMLLTPWSHSSPLYHGRGQCMRVEVAMCHDQLQVESYQYH